MNIIKVIIDFIMHIDKNLEIMIKTYGMGAYAILGAIIFAETGLVVLPFLPGDSLLFAAGALSAKPNGFSFPVLLLVCISMAFIGNTVNYFIGSFFGKKILSTNFFKKIIKDEQLKKAHDFFEKHGVVSIVLARFVPILRTVVPFIAGISEMSWKKYMFYNFIGAVSWVTLLLSAGSFFGNIPFVEKNFSVVVLAIVFISVLPVVFEVIRKRKK